MEEKKNSSTAIIVILVLIIVALGGFIAYDKLLAKDDSNVTNVEADEGKEENVDLVFDENSIYNKDSSYRYKEIAKQNNPEYVKANGTKYLVNDSLNNISYELTKKYVDYIETTIFKGGPGMDNYKVIFLNEDGSIDYLKYDIFESDNNGNIKYGFRLYRINNLKNVKKLYLVELSSNREVSPNGQTVVAQTTDGTLYDLFDYVYGDTNLIDSSK